MYAWCVGSSRSDTPAGANPRVLAAFAWFFVVLTLAVLHWPFRLSLVNYLSFDETLASAVQVAEDSGEASDHDEVKRLRVGLAREKRLVWLCGALALYSMGMAVWVFIRADRASRAEALR
jgi:hypothetical protein